MAGFLKDPTVPSPLDRLPDKNATPPAAPNPAAGGSTSDPYITALTPGAVGNPAAGGVSDPSDPPLLWKNPGNGPGRPRGTYNDQVVRHIAANTPGDTLKLSDAKNAIFADDAYRGKVAQQMVAAGLLDPTQINDLGAIQKAWNQVVGQAAAFYAAGNYRTPEEVIALINVQRKHTKTFPRTTTADSTQAQDFGTDGPSRIRATLQQTLGRAPTAGEMATYQAGLNAAAQANPQQQHSVTTQDANGNTVTNTTNSGGIDPTEVLGQMAQTDPEYGAYQASTTYMDALKQAIGAFVG